QQTSAPPTTPTVAASTGPLLPGIDGTKVVRYEIRDNTSGNFTTLSKDTGGAWHIDGTNTLSQRDPDQSTINSTVGQITTVQYTNSFTDTQLSTFGLDKPSYTILVTTSDNKLYTVYIGSKSPTNPSYYAIVQQGAAPAATAEATAIPTGNAVTPTPSPTVVTTVAATAPASAGKLLFQAQPRQATSATAEATAEATSNANVVPTVAVTDLGPVAGTVEVTPETTAAVTAYPTANVIHNPGVTLTGSQTIYVVPQTVINTLTGWISTPPYAPLPTPTPTEAVTAEPTAAATAEATKASAPATAEATTESTAAATAAS
ncbi:MAG TPA: DUF4340 domain-containing protein, partial [Phototrophicaceae bacterium]|nr:DUF4340 domain-containing protein [Phototrophicaceae bacterium]